MKKFLLLLVLSSAITISSCNSDPVADYASRMAKIGCKGEQTDNPEEKRKLREEYIQLEQEVKRRYKDDNASAIRLTKLYFDELQDCLGYVPVR